jgi:hypothetical protein
MVSNTRPANFGITEVEKVHPIFFDDIKREVPINGTPTKAATVTGTDAKQYSVNAHGLRRTNADKRRCVEVAAREFPDKSSDELSRMCAVDSGMVRRIREGQSLFNRNSTIIGVDGKHYRAKRKAKATMTRHAVATYPVKVGDSPCRGA